MTAGTAYDDFLIRTTYDHPVLTPQQERALFARYVAAAEGSAERSDLENQIATNNMRLVRSIAGRYSQRGIDDDDLFGWGCVGLLTAIRRFEPSRGHKFSTYATHWIRQAVTRGIDTDSRIIKIPVHAHDRIRHIKRIISDHITRYGKSPTTPEIAGILNLKPQDIDLCLAFFADCDSTDRKVSNYRDDLLVGDALASPEDLEANAMHAALGRDLAEVMARLDDRERYIVARRYGLGCEPATHDVIGKELGGITRQRVQQIEHGAIEKLKHPAIRRKLAGYLEGQPA